MLTRRHVNNILVENVVLSDFKRHMSSVQENAEGGLTFPNQPRPKFFFKNQPLPEQIVKFNK